MINKILKELDRMIEIQQRSADRAEQMSNDVATYLEYKELAAYLKVQDMIKKCAQEAATSEGTDVNSLTQADYNTDDKKSEIRRLVCEILDICLCRMEDKNEFIKEAKGSDPEISFKFDGLTSRFAINVIVDDEHSFAQIVYLDGAFEDKASTIESLKNIEKNISKLLEMRKVDDLKEVEE